eukprot:TRINITY_DN7049_c0_g1_i14.p1 TRINITY_DN7049_c0_g1~~TRINITY_DN7049_c0_g1_i14.p1  ORF type:complete len:120 (+),score=23.74 TRINITY_DN7049_c0_g1_i14:45-362(+)
MQSGLHTMQLDTRIPHEQIAKREASPAKRSPSPRKGSRQCLPVKPVHAVKPVPTEAMQSGLHDDAAGHTLCSWTHEFLMSRLQSVKRHLRKGLPHQEKAAGSAFL